MRPAESGNLATQADMTETILDSVLNGTGQVGNGKFRCITAWFFQTRFFVSVFAMMRRYIISQKEA